MSLDATASNIAEQRFPAHAVTAPAEPIEPALGAVIGSELVDILIVDDEPEVLAVLKRQMQRKGYSVRTAADAQAASAELATCRPRVILLDLMMPRIDGAAFLSNLRATHSPGALPVIIVTASNQRNDMLRCLDAGANDFVTKPVDLDALVARVEVQIAVSNRFRALEQSESIDDSCAENAKEALWAWTPAGDALTASRNFAAVCKLDKAPTTLAEWLAAARPADGAALVEELDRLRAKHTREIEAVVRMDEDVARALLVRARLDEEADGERITGAVIDITVPFLRDSESLLPTRGALIDRLAELREEAGAATLIGFNADRFDELTLAHDIARGEDALRIYVWAIKRATESIGELYRTGPTEFAILVNADAPVGEIRSWARRIAAGNDFGVQIGDEQIHRISAVVGVVLASKEAPEETLFRLKLALKSAFEAGEGRVREYSDDMREIRLRHARMDSRLSVALERQSIEPLFEPMVDVDTGRWRGVEASPGWCDEELGSVPMSELFACADTMGCAFKLVESYVSKALRVGRQINEIVRRPLDLVISVPEQAAGDPGLPSLLSRLASEADFDLDHLVVQVAEDGVLYDFDACASVFRQLNDIGVRVAISEFGSGYSSLAYLCRVPAQSLKFDELMLHAALERSDARTLLGTMSRMARHLEKSVIVCGVADAEQLQIAREIGAEMVEGRLTSRVLSAEELITTLKATS
ncbi:MAG: EAL domain-containing protein [Maricaulaceae bacterium]|jgi:EAL domain-containing protein (putative c-di-GMP-specific phosphodiesterase class I)/DNA-binding response OmpR family regulator/GGDEF domain-containing protein